MTSLQLPRDHQVLDAAQQRRLLFELPDRGLLAGAAGCQLARQLRISILS